MANGIFSSLIKSHFFITNLHSQLNVQKLIFFVVALVVVVVVVEKATNNFSLR
jgi:hypothetical protein